jgi:hypothetical protein
MIQYSVVCDTRGSCVVFFPVQTCAWAVEKHKNYKDMATFVFKEFAKKYVSTVCPSLLTSCAFTFGPCFNLARYPSEDVAPRRKPRALPE